MIFLEQLSTFLLYISLLILWNYNLFISFTIYKKLTTIQKNSTEKNEEFFVFFLIFSVFHSSKQSNNINSALIHYSNLIHYPCVDWILFATRKLTERKTNWIMRRQTAVGQIRSVTWGCESRNDSSNSQWRKTVWKSVPNNRTEC